MKICATWDVLLLSLVLFAAPALGAVEQSDALNTFIAEMVGDHRFEEKELTTLFQQVEVKQNILRAISSPAEALPWYKYRKIFLTDSRIKDGLKFWRDNETVMAAVEEKYGVPAAIITAIIGVETRYGENTGSFRVIDALSTLAFAYPKRSQFFREELKQFLLLCREEQMNPLEPVGSYAGAMGVPQFMPSSYRRYATDFDQDKKRDIWHNNADVIASVAHYFSSHQWQKNGEIAFPVTAQREDYRKALTKGLKPDVTVGQLRQWRVDVREQLGEGEMVKLLAYELENEEQLWVGLHNFYVITRYNHSPLYAMAVFQLSQAIAELKQAKHEL